ncbi:hypothetical protein [Flavobacterium bizetiae]
MFFAFIVLAGHKYQSSSFVILANRNIKTTTLAVTFLSTFVLEF